MVAVGCLADPTQNRKGRPVKATTSVSTTFAATHDRHRVGLLVTLAGELSAARPPINVALVLDRSGSMAGEPLAHAREAAIRFASFLSAEDRLSVVAFDDEVRCHRLAAAIFGAAEDVAHDAKILLVRSVL